jgi:hypothetical protein
MKNIIGLTLALVALAGSAMATTVNPTSNVLGDTAGTASTLVLRDTNGVVDASNLIQSATILTAHLNSSAVTTPKLFFANLTAGRAVCVLTNGSLGMCKNTTQSDGSCSCQ